MVGNHPNGSGLSATVEDRVFEIGEEYLDRLLAGEETSMAMLAALRPELAPHLERHLALVELLFRAGIS